MIKVDLTSLFLLLVVMIGVNALGCEDQEYVEFSELLDEEKFRSNLKSYFDGLEDKAFYAAPEYIPTFSGRTINSSFLRGFIYETEIKPDFDLMLLRLSSDSPFERCLSLFTFESVFPGKRNICSVATLIEGKASPELIDFWKEVISQER